MRQKLIAGAVATVLAGLYLFMAIDRSGPATTNKEPDELEACVAAQRLVLQSLRAPSTARQGDCLRASAEVAGYRAWTIRTYIDSQNSAGAMVRTHFAMKVRFVGDKWVQENLSVVR